MTLLFKLIWRDLRANPGRVAVSVFAILVSVSLIVWMMGSYDTLVKEFDNDAEAYMGSYDLCLVPEAPKGASHAAAGKRPFTLKELSGCGNK